MTNCFTLSGCTDGTGEPFTYTRPSSREFCYPIQHFGYIVHSTHEITFHAEQNLSSTIQYVTLHGGKLAWRSFAPLQKLRLKPPFFCSNRSFIWFGVNIAKTPKIPPYPRVAIFQKLLRSPCGKVQPKQKFTEFWVNLNLATSLF